MRTARTSLTGRTAVFCYGAVSYAVLFATFLDLAGFIGNLFVPLGLGGPPQVGLWEQLGGVVWQIDNPLGQAIMWSAFGAGWLLVLVATFLINHFDLLGLRQVWLHLRAMPYTTLRFATPWLYRLTGSAIRVG